MACMLTSPAVCFISARRKRDQSRVYQLQSFDLQLFAGEKTEEPTAKKQQEARDKGQIPKSIEINSVFIVLAAFLTLKSLGQFMYDQLLGYMREIFSQPVTSDFTVASTQVLFLNCSLVFMKTALPVMVVILLVSVVINYLQVGFVFTAETLMPTLDKLNPITGFQRLFSKRSLVEVAKALVKVSVVGYFVYRFIARESQDLPKLMEVELVDSMQFVGSLLLSLIYQISAVMLVLAALDYFYQGWEHKESLKMTKQEVKEENKQTEGNPEVKSKIKERQRALAMRRMMQEVPKASVVVTNPTHFAIALKYESAMKAPVVVAKGQDLVAQRIKEVAKENSVAIVENKPLAHTLYKVTEIGDVIPPDLYQAVAEVLAYVYRLKKRSS